MDSLQEVPAGAVCARHVTSAARAVCGRCGDFLCSACAEHRAEATFCSTCAPAELFRSSAGTRVAAHLVDSLLFFAAIVVMGIAVGLFEEAGASGVGLAVGIAAGPVAFTVVQCVLIHKRAQSIGKALLGIRLAQLDGTPPGLLRVVFLRNAVPGLIGQIPLVGIVFGVANVVTLFGDERRALHDRIAGTIVVDTPERIAKTFGA